MYTRSKQNKKKKTPTKFDGVVSTSVEQSLEVTAAPASIKRPLSKTTSSSNLTPPKKRSLTSQTPKLSALQNITDLYQKFSLLKLMCEVHSEPYVEQREAGVDEMHILHLNNGIYTLESKESPPKISTPSGDYEFVILSTNPFEVVCARTRNFVEFGFGHTSITKKAPVIFAGAASFSQGRLTKWNNRSGHYKLAADAAHTQLLPWASRLLPMSKYQPVP